MFPTPRADLTPNTPDNETTPLIVPTGFREYDARWLYPDQINLSGFQALGMGLATQMIERGLPPTIVVAHDYRSYSQSLKLALVTGLMACGAEVIDIGLALSPMAYFAQFDLDTTGVAMVTASHNENGWCGVKMGLDKPLTHGVTDMARLKKIVLSGEFASGKKGSYRFEQGVRERYLADMLDGHKLNRKLKVVAACGNGTAGVFAPEMLERLGCEVIPLHCEPDFTFPNHNPNPEDMGMLHAVRDAVLAHGADVGLAFDGDGDRCGVVDDKGEEIFADKVGLMIARDQAVLHPGSTFVVDVKSTGLFATDPVLKEHGCKTDYWMTGHSHMKRRVNELGALTGFEKSGHYFFNKPIGRGYDCGLISAIAICEMLDRAGCAMSVLKSQIGTTWTTPTMAPYCPDETKYDVVEKAVAHVQAMKERGETILGQAIIDVNTINGARFTIEDGTWGLIRASSNKPSLVVVCESAVSEARMKDMFHAVDAILQTFPDIGEYDQKL